MGKHETYLTIGYLLSIGLLLVYRLWVGLRRRALERERQKLEHQGGKLHEDV